MKNLHIRRQFFECGTFFLFLSSALAKNGSCGSEIADYKVLPVLNIKKNTRVVYYKYISQIKTFS